mgnify:CR=1 FL=1
MKSIADLRRRRVERARERREVVGAARPPPIQRDGRHGDALVDDRHAVVTPAIESATRDQVLAVVRRPWRRPSRSSALEVRIGAVERAMMPSVVGADVERLELDHAHGLEDLAVGEGHASRSELLFIRERRAPARLFSSSSSGSSEEPEPGWSPALPDGELHTRCMKRKMRSVHHAHREAPRGSRALERGLEGASKLSCPARARPSGSCGSSPRRPSASSSRSRCRRSSAILAVIARARRAGLCRTAVTIAVDSSAGLSRGSGRCAGAAAPSRRRVRGRARAPSTRWRRSGIAMPRGLRDLERPAASRPCPLDHDLGRVRTAHVLRGQEGGAAWSAPRRRIRPPGVRASEHRARWPLLTYARRVLAVLGEELAESAVGRRAAALAAGVLAPIAVLTRIPRAKASSSAEGVAIASFPSTSLTPRASRARSPRCRAAWSRASSSSRRPHPRALGPVGDVARPLRRARSVDPESAPSLTVSQSCAARNGASGRSIWSTTASSDPAEASFLDSMVLARPEAPCREQTAVPSRSCQGDRASLEGLVDLERASGAGDVPFRCSDPRDYRPLSLRA